MRLVYGRGLNIAGQIDNTFKNYKKFQPIKQLQSYQIKGLGCGYLQSYYLLTDNQLLKTGHYMDTLTSARLLNFYRALPRTYKNFQIIRSLATKAGLLASQDYTLLNKRQVIEGVQFKHAVFGHAGINLFDTKDNMYTIGQNYFGQRGTNDDVPAQNFMKKIDFLHLKSEQALLQDKQQTESSKKRQLRITDIALGFQHSVIITQSGQAYGCGKADSNQIQPYRYHFSKDIISVEKILIPQLIYGKRKVIKAACGYKHTLLLTQDGKLYALGLNKYGQCGLDYTKHPNLQKITQVYFPYLENQKILDIKCGSNHTLILTNFHVYFMGNISQNQNPYISFKQNISSPTLIPLESRPIKIFTNFDRNAIITENGKLYIFGGKDLSKRQGQSGKLQIIDNYKFDQNSLVGLGFSHTIIYP